MKFLRIAFTICFLICFLITLKTAKMPETSLLDAFVVKNSANGNYISKLSDISNKSLNIIIETETIDENEDIKSDIENQLSKINSNNDISSEIIEIYKNYPTAFLSKEARKNLINKNYNEIEKRSFELLYNPIGFFVSPPDKDPFLFATDFVLSNKKFSDENFISKDEKIYSLIRIEPKDKDTINEIKKIIKPYTKNVYLSGTPIHAYETQKSSSLEINIICFLSFLAVISLCYYFFKSYKILLPVILSILFGFLTGFIFSTLIFNKLHILTFVFSTSLIGIGFDYSLHYFLSNKDKKFQKSLLISLISTVMMFSMLYFSQIEILKQISVFVSFGLIGVYAFVCLFLPLFKIEIKNTNILKPFHGKRFKKPVLIFVIAIIIAGLCKMHFDDSIKNLYKPKKELIKSETIYKNTFSQNPINFIIVEGENINKILQKEEKITESLDKKNIDFIALSSFIPSKERQEENIKLVSSLYKKRLNSYANFLNSKQKSELVKNKKIYTPEAFPLKDKFMPDNNHSFITMFSDDSEFESINITNEMNNILKSFRKKCLKFIPFLFLILFIVLKFFHKTKDCFKIILPSFLGGIFALCCISLFNIEINIFHLLAFILTIGFSLDYSIFRIKGDEKSNLAVLISSASTIFSFFLLSFTSFRLIASLGLILSLGILSSYILCLLLIKTGENNE